MGSGGARPKRLGREMGMGREAGVRRGAEMPTTAADAVGNVAGMAGGAAAGASGAGKLGWAAGLKEEAEVLHEGNSSIAAVVAAAAAVAAGNSKEAGGAVDAGALKPAAADTQGHHGARCGSV